MNQSVLKSLEQDLLSLKNVVMNSIYIEEGSTPKYILSEKFYEDYFDKGEVNFSLYNSSNPLFRAVSFQEYRAISLNYYLNKSKTKYNSKNPSVPCSASQLITVNNIIRNSFELTTLIYLLDWLHKIFKKDDNLRIKIENSLNLNQTITSNAVKGKFYPDLLLHDNTLINNKELDNHSKILELIISKVKTGKLQEAQRLAENYGEHNISAMLNGGLPYHDFKIDKENLFLNVDFDLFPSFMKNKELAHVYDKLYNIKQSNEKSRSEAQKTINFINDSIIGNANWQLWLYSNFQSADQDFGTKSYKLGNLQTLLSGNVNFAEKHNHPLYEKLYSYFTSFLNLKLLENYDNFKVNNNNEELLDYHFIDEVSLSECYEKFKGKTVIDIINQIRSHQLYKDLANKVSFNTYI